MHIKPDTQYVIVRKKNWISYLLCQAFMAHIVWYSENMELSFIQRLIMSRNMNVLQMLIFKLCNSDGSNLNELNLYNSAADTDIKRSKYQSSLYISNNMSQ